MIYTGGIGETKADQGKKRKKKKNEKKAVVFVEKMVREIISPQLF